MAGETVITIVGNLTADPELRTIGSGATVASFTIASTPRTWNRQTNQFEDGQALFMRCSAWRDLADHCAQSLKKGMRVIATGRLQQRSYQAQDGSQRTVVEMQLDEIGPSQRRKAEAEEHLSLLRKLKGKPTETKSGQRVHLYANISRPSDVAAVLANDAEGIGLFRSEFLYLEREDWPTEEFQFDAYRQVAQEMGDRLVIIRTLDIGADKQVDYFNLDHEDNPALGYRAIRICLTRPEIFKVQLRALLRASAYGNIAIMLPMITSVQEVRDAKRILEEAKSELRGEHTDFNESIQIGVMIETPASVIMADELAAEVDFFSIGTNDLTQYTLACDRQTPSLERFADPHSPAVLRMIQMTIEAAHRHGIWCGICGELGADLSLTDTFLCLGIDELSVSPTSVLPLRNVIRNH